MPRRLHPVLAAAILLAPLYWLVSAAPVAAQPGENIREFIARTGEILQMAADVVLQAENPQARRILNEARNLHHRSGDLLERGQPRNALATSRRAREAAQHAARLARESQSHDERFRLRLERLQELRDQLLERVRETEDERALRFLREADEQTLSAQNQYRQRNFELALHLLGTAEELLARTTRLLFEGAGGERLDREIERTRALIERAGEHLQQTEGQPRETGADLLQSATQALRRAEEFRDRQQPVRALQSLRLARQLAAQVVAIGGAPTDRTVVEAQIERWDERYPLVAEAVHASGSPQAAALLARARHHRDEAGRRLAAGDDEPALRQLRAAFDLLQEASDVAR